jgi:uncharacterized protein YbjQ (UPF0145 family)
MGELFGTVVPLLLMLGLGLFVGRTVELRHFRSIVERETQMSDMLVTQMKSFPCAVEGPQAPKMIVKEVVIAADYLKSFLAGLRNIFGGEVKSFQRMQDRAHREVVLRIMEQARSEGYNAICNVRVEHADIGGNANTRKMAMAAVLASATAYHAQQ